MFVPTLSQGDIVDESGKPTKGFQNLIIQLLQNMQQSLSNEGFVIPSVSSDPASVSPATHGGKLRQIQESFGKQNGALAGCLIFDPFEQNGATSPAKNGQLKILLDDGIFHKITNS